MAEIDLKAEPARVNGVRTPATIATRREAGIVGKLDGGEISF